MVAPLASEVLERLKAQPSLNRTLTFTQVEGFLRMTRKIWPEITSGHKSTTQALPVSLPSNACNFIAAVLGLDSDLTQLCWITFRDFAAPLDTHATSDDDLFRIHGQDHQVGDVIPVFVSITNS
jgi:hypothetical protein